MNEDSQDSQSSVEPLLADYARASATFQARGDELLRSSESNQTETMTAKQATPKHLEVADLRMEQAYRQC